MELNIGKSEAPLIDADFISALISCRCCMINFLSSIEVFGNFFHPAAIRWSIVQVFTAAPIVDFLFGSNFSLKRVSTVLLFPAPSAPKVTNLNWLEHRSPFSFAFWYASIVCGSRSSKIK